MIPRCKLQRRITQPIFDILSVLTWREAGHGCEQVVVDDGPVLLGLLPADGRRRRRRDEELLGQRRQLQVRLLVRARRQHLRRIKREVGIDRGGTNISLNI